MDPLEQYHDRLMELQGFKNSLYFALADDEAGVRRLSVAQREEAREVISTIEDEIRQTQALIRDHMSEYADS